MNVRHVGLIGCGTIGRHLAQSIDSGSVPNAVLTSLFDMKRENAESLRVSLEKGCKVCSEFEEFLNSGIDLVVEAASQDAVMKFSKEVVSSGKDIMIMSVGALADSDAYAELVKIAAPSGASIFIPTGAIAGIDAIRSVRHLIQEVVLRTTKSPLALAGARFFSERGMKPETIKKKQVIYRGHVAEAVRLFPANVNVAAVLSIAGAGPEKTQVEVVADPDATTNKHEIEARGSFGEIRISVNNVPSPGNPKTSYLAILSAIECLRSVCNDSVRIGS
jgi:aspartate dehydrogenase